MLNTNSNEKLYMFESFISEAPGPVAIFDNEVKYLACSKKWLEVYSINKENIIGLNHYDLFPETPDDWKQVHIRCLNGETISRDEDKFARLDCSVQWVSWSLSPWHKQDGSIGGFIAYTNDITDYVENKLEIEKQLQSMREAQELANIGHWELDLIENNLYWSDEVYRIFGLNPQEFEATYEAFLDRIHPDDREMVNNAYSTSVANRTSYHIVHRVLTIDGKIKYVEERCLHDFDSSGNVKRSIGTVHDITESIKSKKEIELASKVFENTQEGILISDENNTIIKVNDAYTKITGFTEEELVGNNPRAINSGWQNDEFYQTMWDSISEKGYWSGELLDRKKDGTLFQAELSISTVRNDKNEIINYIAIISDITDRKEKEDKIHRMAYYDFLTNVPNRTLVQERVKHLIKTHRESKQFALMLMDADNFKLINDTLGHKLGDEFLKSFANRITEILPESVTFGRLGGDEFIVLVEDIQELKDVTRIATNILEEARKPFNISNNIVHVSVSMGISVFPDNGGSYDNLIMNADTAMYSVKKDTKNDFKFFTSKMNEDAHDRLWLDSALRKSIELNELEVYYQPKISTLYNNVVGFEALIRWNCNKRGMISPSVFIPIAEENGFINDIGEFVLRSVCNDINNFFYKYGEDFKISINVSGVQFKNGNLVQKFSQIVKDRRICTHHIELEITETAVINDYELVIKQLVELKNFGFTISLDDFGTGYSSLSYLKKLPINIMKIDKSFIDDIDVDTESYEIVKATVYMSKALGLVTVAEGVETEAQLSKLREIGCDIIQGYYYSAPLPKNKLEEYLDSTIKSTQS